MFLLKTYENTQMFLLKTYENTQMLTFLVRYLTSTVTSTEKDCLVCDATA